MTTIQLNQFFKSFWALMQECDFKVVNRMVKDGMKIEDAAKAAIPSYIELRVYAELQKKKIQGRPAVDWAADIVLVQYLKWLKEI